MNIIKHARDGQPLTGSPKIRVLTIITIIEIKDIKQNINPKKADITSGFVENASIPSIPYLNNLKILNFDFPAIRFGVLYSIHLVLNPTKLNIPFI